LGNRAGLLPVIVDEDGNYCACDLKVSAKTVYLAGTGSVVILPSIPAIAAGDFDIVKRRIVEITRVK